MQNNNAKKTAAPKVNVSALRSLMSLFGIEVTEATLSAPKATRALSQSQVAHLRNVR